MAAVKHFVITCPACLAPLDLPVQMELHKLEVVMTVDGSALRAHAAEQHADLIASAER